MFAPLLILFCLFTTQENEEFSKLNSFADKDLNVTPPPPQKKKKKKKRKRKEKNAYFFFNRIENIVEKGENAGYQYFLFFPQCFPNRLH